MTARDPIDSFVDEIERLKADNAELNALFDLQYKRTTEATKAWRKANPDNDNVLPDLGNLLEWMLKEIARLQKWQQEALPWLEEVRVPLLEQIEMWSGRSREEMYRNQLGELDRLIAEAQEVKE